MNVDYLQEYLNHSVETIAIQLERFLVLAHKTFEDFSSGGDNWARIPIQFTPLQFTLLKVLLVLLLGTAGLIWYSWRTFGKVITEKFVRPSTLKEIEELKLSVAKLKLPKEHSPRI